ncbi:MAG: hypothetical protein PHF33_10600 [Candidatus Delongbacteria bacterium]|jgi:hypothetical protein|nr:hypothetical protein [Candidatus Delongbacteria bacterium]MDD4205860.1 hypothetical protein [Candidatus Delongbacteria bacterium]MDY0016498.1 hypothetical protein [Candidatus Delongbacteria bacterium]
MKAIEISSKTDRNGHLKIDYPLELSESRVRVIILLEEKDRDFDDEKIWMKAVSNNPDFDFLKDKEEDIYSIDDGVPFNG